MEDSNTGRADGWWAPIVTTLLKPFFRSPERGAETSIHLATAPELADVTGQYFKDLRAVEAAAHATDVENARRLWERSTELCGRPASETAPL